MTARRACRLLSSSRVVDGLVLLGLLVLAAALRLPNLDGRSPFDADQGRIMLVLERWLRQGEIPLLGPPASVGDLHHGALFFYLLAPAAALGDLDPTAVVGVVAAAGIAAVGLVWYLARAIGGRIAGLAAGLLFAVSATDVARSTSLWNPGLVPFGSALAAAASWEAWRSRRPGWWLVAAVGAAVALQGHLSSAVTVVPLTALAIADLRRSRGGRRVAAAVLAAAAIVGLSYLPLLVHELGSGFAEARALAAELAGGASGERSLWTLFVVTLRVASTSLVGLVTKAPELAILVTIALALGTVWLTLGPPRVGAAAEGSARTVPERQLGVRWLGGVVLVGIPALWLAAPGLATVVETLPVDHYHAASDPLVVALAGIVVGSLVEAGRRARAPSPGPRPRRAAELMRAGGPTVVAALAVIGLGLWNLATQPPPVVPDGWPAIEAAARRVATSLPKESVALLRSLPSFTAPDAMTFALHAIGRAAVGPDEGSGDGRAPRPGEPPWPPRPASGTALVVVCDDRFRAALRAPCGGPAEAAWLGSAPWLGSGAWTLVDRFAVAGDRYLSVYLPAPDEVGRT